MLSLGGPTFKKKYFFYVNFYRSWQCDPKKQINKIDYLKKS
jgi:hypothetical protein